MQFKPKHQTSTFLRKAIALLILFTWFCTPISAQSAAQKIADSSIIAYTEQYNAYAVAEMERTGIPASITLAQAICESRYGTSEVSKVAKNHFGIKCYKAWKGKRYFHKDDDYKKGKLVPSCFRYYASVRDSYRDHSDFLIGRPWYEKLFKLASDDYKGWAAGLLKAGYAHPPDYDQRLLKYIDKFDLHRFDKAGYKLDRKKLKIDMVSSADSLPNIDEIAKRGDFTQVEKTTILTPKSPNTNEPLDTAIATFAPITPTKKDNISSLKKQIIAKDALDNSPPPKIIAPSQKSKPTLLRLGQKKLVETPLVPAKKETPDERAPASIPISPKKAETAPKAGK